MEVDKFNHESPVIAYNKSPFTASLPTMVVLVFMTLIMQSVAWFSLIVSSEVWPFFGAMCFNLFFLIAFPLQLLHNKELGDRISVDPGKSRIWVSHRGLRTKFKQRRSSTTPGRVRNGSVNYENSDFIRIAKRTVEVDYNDTLSPILPGPFCDIRLYRIDGSHKTIFTIDGWALSKIKAARIGKSIARAAGLDYRHEPARDAQGFGSTRIDSDGSDKLDKKKN
tara:strand:- start:250 stop:918 length:669 start_codon:yes stop_codon:yes gene_type:complete